MALIKVFIKILYLWLYLLKKNYTGIEKYYLGNKDSLDKYRWDLILKDDGIKIVETYLFVAIMLFLEG